MTSKLATVGPFVVPQLSIPFSVEERADPEADSPLTDPLVTFTDRVAARDKFSELTGQEWSQSAFDKLGLGIKQRYYVRLIEECAKAFEPRESQKLFKVRLRPVVERYEKELRRR